MSPRPTAHTGPPAAPAPPAEVGALGTGTLAPVGAVRVSTRTSDRVYAELTAAIRELRLRPGATLSETELARQLRVSRTPVREAISRLVADGLVSVVPQVGTRVQPIDLAAVEQARFIREHLELGAYAAACAQPVRDVSGLRDLLAQQEHCHAARDVDGFFAADEALHREIFALAGYPGAWRLMQPTKVQLDRLRRLSLPDPAYVRVLIDEHLAIVDALAAGDAEGGSAHLRRHARRVLDYAPQSRRRHPELFTEEPA